MPDSIVTLRDNLERVRHRIAAAAIRSGRRPEDVTLVAATKYVDGRWARQLVAAGCIDLGESRPQELCAKACELQDLAVRWHLIGHLQRNKIRRTLPYVACLHSADSCRLLDALQLECTAIRRTLPVLLEVNISGEEAKHGFTVDELPSVVREWRRWPHLELRGFMGMSGLDADEVTVRRQFAGLRALRDRCRELAPPGTTLPDLSMGMSSDLEIAVEEGATLVRVGSALFEGLEDNPAAPGR